jgi:hypothetical protein
MANHLPTNISIDGELLYVTLFLFLLKYLCCSFGRGNYATTSLLFCRHVEGPWDLLRYVDSIIIKIIHLVNHRITAFDEPSFELHALPFEIRYGLLIKNISTEHPLVVS